MLQIPIGHMEGNYFCDESTLAALQRDDRIAFRYATPSGEITAEANPNGSLDNIAGVLNEGRNVLGMMPHPGSLERSAARLRRWLPHLPVHDRGAEWSARRYGRPIA